LVSTSFLLFLPRADNIIFNDETQFIQFCFREVMSDKPKYQKLF